MADTEWIDSPGHREGGRQGTHRRGGEGSTPTRQPTAEQENPAPNPTSNSASQSSPSSSSPSVPMRQLEFTQAMNDFHHMFPSMDREVIEAVLRANNGIVDATIDQLLTMSIDNNEDDDDLPDHILMSVQRDVALESVNENTHSHNHKSPSSRPSKQEDPSMEESPPSYTEAIKSPQIMTTPHRHHHHHHHANRSSPPTSHRRGSPRHHPHHHRHSPPTTNLLDLDSDPLALSNTETKLPLSTQESSAISSSFQASGNQDSPSRWGWGDTSTSHSKRSALKTSSRHRAHFSQDTEDATVLHKTHQHRKVSWDTGSLPIRSKSFGAADGKRAHPHSHHHRSSNSGGSPRKLPPYRNWNPPMLGTLPDDFLRLKPKVPQRVPLMTQKSDPGHRRTTATALHRSMSSRDDHGESGSQSQRSHTHHTPLRSMSFAASTSRSNVPGMPHRIITQDISTDYIQRRMRENERRRRQASVDLDPELSQYLEDERLALILQNSEFLQELRDDETFMKTLERDRQVAADEYASAQELKKQKAILAAAMSASAAEVEPVPPVSLPVLGPDDQEGYGDDRQDTLEAFPFSQQLPKASESEEDAEFLQKLRHMGKASKKQFAALARRFFSRKRKKSPRHLLRDSATPSMINLLDEVEVEDYDDELLGSSPSGTATGSGRSGFRVDGLPPSNATDMV